MDWKLLIFKLFSLICKFSFLKWFALWCSPTMVGDDIYLGIIYIKFLLLFQRTVWYESLWWHLKLIPKINKKKKAVMRPSNNIWKQLYHNLKNLISRYVPMKATLGNSCIKCVHRCKIKTRRVTYVSSKCCELLYTPGDTEQVDRLG